MNFRFFYIALVLVFSYMLFFSWNQESKQKQELAESSYIEQIKEDQANPPQESSGFVEIENKKLIVKIAMQNCNFSLFGIFFTYFELSETLKFWLNNFLIKWDIVFV